MWSLCAMRERRQWWWWGWAPGCKVRNSALGTVLSENLALIGPSSCYYQLPTQICWQVLSVQKQSPCQLWTEVQARRRALWHNPLQSCTESLDKTQARRFCPSWVRVAANQWDSTLGKEQIVKCLNTTLLKLCFLLACSIFGHIVLKQKRAVFFVGFFVLPSQQPRMKWSKTVNMQGNGVIEHSLFTQANLLKSSSGSWLIAS